MTPSFAQTATPARMSVVRAFLRPRNKARPAVFSEIQFASETECDASNAITTSTGYCVVMLYMDVTSVVTFTYSVTFTVVLYVTL